MNKLINNLQFRVYTDILKKSKKDGKRLIRGYASTATLDRQNEVITIEALRQAADHLLENHTVFYEHEHQKFPVGKVVETGIDDKGLKVIVEISQTADQLWTLIEEDILDSFSIGGRVISAEEKVGNDGKPYNEITGIELFEVSVVGLPANSEAKFALVNKSFNMAITDEIKKRKEDREMEEKKKIETISPDTTKAKAVTLITEKATISDGTSNPAEITEPKAEEKKVEKVVKEKAEKKEETTKVKEKEDSKVVEKKEDAQKRTLERYERDDRAVAEKIEKEKIEKEVKKEKSEPVEEKKEKPKVEGKKEEEVEDDNDAVWDFLIDEVENAKQYPYPYRYPYPYYPYPYAKLGEEVKEIIFLLDKLIAKETNEDAKAIMQEIKAKVSKLVGQEYPYPEKYPYPKKKDEAGKQYPAPEAALKEILAGLKDLGKKIDEVLERLPEKDVKVKEPEEIKEEPKVEEGKQEKVEKKVEKKIEKIEEKPQRKSFIADAPYAPEEKKEEKNKDAKKPTQKGWTRIIYGDK